MAKPMNFKSFKVGDPIELVALDHTSDDTVEGWVPASAAMKLTPHKIYVRGYFVGEDEFTIKVAFAKCAGTFSTFFNVIKGTIVEAKK